MSDVYERSRELSLADLAPERLTFWDTAYGGDGARHEWRMHDDMGLEELGGLRRIQDELGRGSALIGRADADAATLEQAAAKISGGLDAFLHLILPGLSAARLAAIPLRGKQHMLQWWQARQAPAEAGEDASPLATGAAAPATPPRKRSPASSRATA